MKIFFYLDPVSAACFGVANRRLYNRYFELYSGVSLLYPRLRNPGNEQDHLFELLKTWLGYKVDFCQLFIKEEGKKAAFQEEQWDNNRYLTYESRFD